MASFKGNDKANVLTGGTGGDLMYGYGGNDTLSGGKGNDYIHGGYGIDKIYSGDGDDRMNLTTGPAKYSHTATAFELLDGGSGKDNAHIDAKGSFVDGRPTEQINIDYAAPNEYRVSIGSDAGYGNALLAKAVNVESFTLAADGPALYFTGNMSGTGPALTLTATNQADEFCGGRENSTVNLLGGDDVAIVSGGHDVFTLGDGADVVRFNWAYAVPRDGVITDFNVSEDRLDLAGWDQSELTVTDTSGGTWLSGGDDQLFLAGVHDYNPWENAIA